MRYKLIHIFNNTISLIISGLKSHNNVNYLAIST